MPVTLAHRSMTSPFLPQLLSKHWKTPCSRWTLKVRPRASPRWIGQVQRFLWAGAAQPRGDAELVKDAADRQLPLQVREIDKDRLLGLLDRRRLH